jgi:RNA polymerase sigma-70 factor (ECF subfamily)
MENNLEYSVIEKAKLGDINSFEKLIRKYQKQVRVFVFSFFGNIDLVDEISQEVFIKVFKKLKKVRNISNFKKWLFKIAKNTCIDYYRKSKKNKTLSEFNESIIVSDENIEEKFILEEDIKTSLLKLNTEERKTMILIYYLGFSYKEAAEILNCPVKTIDSRVYRASKKLINILPNKYEI